MEAMVKNLSSTVELLAVAAHSDVVMQWDQETLNRAFQWALYSEHVFKRFHNIPVIRGVMEKQLEMTNESLSAVFPQYTALGFSDLPRCRHLLLNGLLHNAHVPLSILKILYDKPMHLDKNQDSYQEAKGICSHIVEIKSAWKVLENLNTSALFGPDVEVQAELLLDKLDTFTKQGSGDQLSEFLDSVCHGCEESGEDFCVVIAAALQTGTNLRLDSVLNWLAVKPDFLEQMCQSLPSLLLADVSKKHVRFRDMYINVLQKSAKAMEYDINNRDWIQVAQNQTVSFQTLTERFVSLFKASVSLRDYVETKLKALKCADGDFEVRGLSVWGDLLSEIDNTMALSQQPTKKT